MPLPPRQREVLELLAAGYTYKQIGAKLVIEPDTVKNHVSKLCRKFDAHNAHGIVGRAFRLGLLIALLLAFWPASAQAGEPLQLRVDQRLVLFANLTDLYGHPARVEDGPPVWSYDTPGTLDLIVSADGYSATVVPKGPLGPVRITAALFGYSDSTTVEIIPGGVAAVLLTAGDPESK
jgi:DNA-binding CsgD family transcriptional regulator